MNGNGIEHIMALADRYAERYHDYRVRASYETAHDMDVFSNALRAAIEQALTPGEPVYQIWRSSDSCGEFYSWEDVDADEFVTSKAHESAKRTLYTAPQPQPEQEPVALAEQYARSHAKFLFKAPQPQPEK